MEEARDKTIRQETLTFQFVEQNQSSVLVVGGRNFRQATFMQQIVFGSIKDAV